MVLALSLWPLFARGAEPAPLKKVDRMRVVGPPVLDATAAEGVYFWLEDGWYYLGATTTLPFGVKKAPHKTMRVHLAFAEDVTAEELGPFKKDDGGERFLELEVVVGAHPERGRFKTEGTVTIQEAKLEGGGAVPIFVGPLAKRAAAGVRIGRF